MSVEQAGGLRSAGILFGCLCLLGIAIYSPLRNLSFVPAAAAQSGQSVNLRADVDLVMIQVSVLDKKGKSINNLKKENFQLYEDGKKQEILSFDEVTEAPGSPSSLNAPVVDNGNRDHGKIVLIVFDDSTIRSDHLKRARDSADALVRQHMKPGDLFAVASFSYGLKFLQNFTDDADKIEKAIAQPALSVGNRASSPGGTDESLPSFGRPQDMDPANAAVRYQAENLLRSLQAVNVSIERIRGRKTVLIFSESDYTDPKTAGKVYTDLLNSAKRANVVYYTADPGGIKTSSMGSSSGSDDSTSAQAGSRRSNGAFSQASTPGQTMSLVKALASDSGGLSIYNTNNFDGELTNVYGQLTNYYVLGFTSNNPKRNGDLRKLEVKVDEKGVTLRYQPSYLDRRPLDVLASSKREGKLLDALASPTPVTQLPIVFRPAYFYDSPRMSRVLVFAKISLGKVQLKRKGDQMEGDLNIVGVAYAEDGSIAGRFSEPVHLTFDKDRDFRNTAVSYRNYFKLEPGKYRVKLAVSDEADSLGSTEQSLEVPAEPEHGFAVSSLVVAAGMSALPDLVQNIQAQMLDDRDPLFYKGMQIVPSADDRVLAGSAIPVLFKIYKRTGDSSQWKLQGKARLVNEKGEELIQPGIDLSSQISIVDKSEAVVGLILNFPSAQPGKYKLIFQITDASSAETATAQTDLELVSR